MTLYCMVGKHRWSWDGRPVRLPSLEDEKTVTVYTPKPSSLGYCVCPFCTRQPPRQHFDIAVNVYRQRVKMKGG